MQTSPPAVRAELSHLNKSSRLSARAPRSNRQSTTARWIDRPDLRRRRLCLSKRWNQKYLLHSCFTRLHRVL